MNYLLAGLCTTRLEFRSIHEVRFEEWLPLFERAGTARMLGLDHFPTAEAQCRGWFERSHQRIADGLGGLNALYSREDGRLIGKCGLLVQEVDGQRELEVGYSLLPANWGQGFAAEAARAARDEAFSRNLTDSLISIIHVDNEPSRKVARANGMHSSKRTIYKELFPVDLFRIDRQTWETLAR
jgi:[ribosomal protein S5]-alanine N-acetyltransferase